MTLRTEPWPAGTPCWIDLHSPEPSKILDFYTTLFGWEYAEQPGDYHLAKIGDHVVAGLGPTHPAAPDGWGVYFASDDVDQTASTVTEHGGTLTVGPAEAGPMGRFVLATDPTGAGFGVWQARAHNGCQVVNQPGGLYWEDLRTSDPTPLAPSTHLSSGTSSTPCRWPATTTAPSGWAAPIVPSAAWAA
ncbi:VOC family protein [Aestuariimicrobium ganziense]|uniref:VOC family protein n=1 Tax=Aestuariimicrobium ganziense TaxID=2773677 RepID=UPI00194395BA|nr:VOC family protein [Aestuariimicrobium ganziense]